MGSGACMGRGQGLPAPACAHQALASLAVVALAVVRYLSMRANTLKRHDNGQPWAHGRKLHKEQQRGSSSRSRGPAVGGRRGWDGLSKRCAG
jgi:hypothetical protein